MADYANLKNSIRNAIKANGNNEITGNLLQQILVSMVSNLGAAFQFAGVATQSTNPGTPDYNVAYLAGPGTYQNMGGSVVPSGYIGVIGYNGSWSVQLISVGSGGGGSVITFNSLPDGTTQVLVDGVVQAIIPSQYTLIKLSAFTTTPSDVANGAFYYNTSDKKIYQKRDLTSVVIPYYDGSIYTYNNALYVWNGTDLVSVGGGGAAFSTEPDDLTLEAVGNTNVLKFANRSYNSQNPNGMGYKILRKDLTFAEQVTDTNTIYEIRYDFNLGGNTITLPSNTFLKFNGGKITNGKINLNSCQIDGVGISCEIGGAGKYKYPLSYYLPDVSNSTLNRKVLQSLLDSECPILIDIPDIEFDDYLSVKTYCTIESLGYKAAKLRFPNSRGLVWDGVGGSVGNNIIGIWIVSNSHSIDFCNNNNGNYPDNVYQSIFSDLRLESAQGNSITSGLSGKGKSGDSLVFDCTFKDIRVYAPNGSGFVGFMSNTMLFERCACLGGGIAMFENCCGKFESVNGTWNGTPTFFKGTYDGTYAIALTAEFSNCNIESYTGVLFDCESQYIYTTLLIHNCVFYVTQSGTINYFPFNIGYLRGLLFQLNVVYINGTFDSSYTLWRIGTKGDSAPVISDVIISATDRNDYKIDYPPVSTIFRGTFALSTHYQKDIFQNDLYRRVEHLFVKESLPVLVDKTINASGALALDGATLFYNLKTDNDVEQVINLDYVTYETQYGNSIKKGGIKFLVLNGTTNTTFQFRHNLGYARRFLCSTGENISIAPGEIVECVFYDEGRCSVAPCGKTYNDMNKAGVTADRPATPYPGYQFFDKTLMKPIWYTGSGWIDATGATV